MDNIELEEDICNSDMMDQKLEDHMNERRKGVGLNINAKESKIDMKELNDLVDGIEKNDKPDTPIPDSKTSTFPDDEKHKFIIFNNVTIKKLCIRL